MTRLRLATKTADFNALHAATETRRATIKVPTAVLRTLLRDHGRALAALGNRNFTQEDDSHDQKIGS